MNIIAKQTAKTIGNINLYSTSYSPANILFSYQILDQICSAMGGRAAEETIFNEISTGALSDLEKVTKQAYAMVSMYGLNDKVGNISYYDS